MGRSVAMNRRGVGEKERDQNWMRGRHERMIVKRSKIDRIYKFRMDHGCGKSATPFLSRVKDHGRDCGDLIGIGRQHSYMSTLRNSSIKGIYYVWLCLMRPIEYNYFNCHAIIVWRGVWGGDAGPPILLRGQSVNLWDKNSRFYFSGALSHNTRFGGCFRKLGNRRKWALWLVKYRVCLDAGQGCGPRGKEKEEEE